MEKKVADLRSHEDCQARLGLTEEAVRNYELAYRAGKSLPALEVFEVDGELIVVDGFHRIEAAKRADVATLPVEIVGKGTMAEAEWEALGKNHSHGVRRTREDKRKAVQVALANPASAKMSNRKLAQYLDVSHTFVAGERKMLDEIMGGNDASPCDPPTNATVSGKRPPRLPRSPELVAADIEWARKLLGADEGKAMLVHCRANAANCKRAGGGWIDNGGEPYKGPLTVSREAQWIRLAINFNRARDKAELNGFWGHAHLNLTHVAGLVARAADCEPREGFWKNIADGFSVDHSIAYDDTTPDPLNHEDLIEELQQLAPHRQVLRWSEMTEWSRGRHTHDRELFQWEQEREAQS